MKYHLLCLIGEVKRMADYRNIKDVKIRLAEIGQRLVNKDYDTPHEKNELYRERYILKHQLAALQEGNTSYFIDWLNSKED